MPLKALSASCVTRGSLSCAAENRQDTFLGKRKKETKFAYLSVNVDGRLGKLLLEFGIEDTALDSNDILCGIRGMSWECV